MILTLTTNEAYKPLVKELIPYLCSASSIQETAACIVLDLSVGPLASSVAQMAAKVELLMEIIPDSLHIIQAGRKDKSKAHSLILFVKLVTKSCVLR
jgi:hypothetical protein